MLALTDASSYQKAFQQGLRPDPLQTISEWADEHMRLPSWSAEPGRWRTSRTPYLREIMDCLSPSSPVREIVFQKAAQIGGTSCGNNWIGFTIHRAPAAMLVVEPTVDVAKKLSKQRIAPMFDAVPVLRGTVKDARSRDSGNTILMKEFTGGMLVLTGANSGVGLRFMSAQNIFFDEVDAYPADVDGEGPPCAVGEKRALTFARHKIYKCSTPLTKLESVIEPAYESSDQRRYQVPCPFCDAGQILQWAHVRWPKDQPELAQYQCAQCEQLIPEHHKTKMLEQGHWVAEQPGRRIAGFHLNALYAPYGWVNSWAHLAVEWTRIIHKRDLRQQQTFTNTNLAETWEETGEKVDTTALWERREVYPAACPDGVLLLTAAADVQDDRIEVECCGWGLGEESWSIDYQRFYGSPGQPEVWKVLDAWLQQTWLHETGPPMKIVQAVIDTGGHHAKEAYEFVKRCRPRRVYALKGSNQPSHPLVGRPSKNNLAHINLFAVGTDTAKDTLFARFKLSDFGPGYCHFPDAETFDEEYFLQLTSEEKRSKFDKGVLQGTYYKKIRARNEALDLKVYNLAALALLNPNLEKLAATPQKAELAEALLAPPPKPVPHGTRLKVLPQGRPPRGGWVGGWMH